MSGGGELYDVEGVDAAVVGPAMSGGGDLFDVEGVDAAVARLAEMRAALSVEGEAGAPPSPWVNCRGKLCLCDAACFCSTVREA